MNTHGAAALGFCGSADDHVHAVLAIHPATSLARVMNQLKGATCRAFQPPEPGNAAALAIRLLGPKQRAHHTFATTNPTLEQNEAENRENHSDPC